MKQFILLIALLTVSIQCFSQNRSDLKLNFNSGDKFCIEILERSDTEQDVMGEKQIIKKNDQFSYDLFLINKPSDSTFYFQISYKRFKSSVEGSDYIETFDTDSVKSLDSPISNYFSSLVNKNIYFEINEKGEIVKIDSLHTVFSIDTAKISDNKLIEMIKKKYGYETVKNISFLTKFPRKEIELKETWNENDTINFGILNHVNAKYILDKISDSTYIINNSSNLITDINNSVSVNGVYISYNLFGSSKAVNILFKNSCMFKESYITQEINGTARMKYSETSDFAYSWPIQIQNTIKTKVKKIYSHEE